MQQVNEQELLNEIFLKPSNEILTDRFSQGKETYAGCSCNGACASGSCKTR